jgi:predicted phage baseplate assembly protein
MLLPLPVLDDTRWADLVEESRSLIPVYAPEWTDHNISDPGITLIELLAWVSEAQIFETDRVGERHRRRFLALLGIRPMSPRPARGVVRFGLDEGAQPLALPAGIVCEAPARDGGDPVAFRTLREVTVVPVEVTRVGVQTTAAPVDLSDRWRGGGPFAPFGEDPRPGAALVLGLDAPLPPGKRVSLAISCATDRAGAEERRRLGDAARLHHGARTVWEVRVGPGHWRALDLAAGEVLDDTRALTLDGRVELEVPGPMHADGAGRYGLRCRFAAGAYDEAPRLADVALNGVAAEQAVRAADAWELAPGAEVVGTPAPGSEAHLDVELDQYGRVSRLDVTEASAPPALVLAYRAPTGERSGELVAEASLLGGSTGGPDQRFTLDPAPVQARSVRLWTREGTAAQVEWRAWSLRPDLESSPPDASHAALDPTTGEVTFGAGDRGRVPPEGAAIVAAHRSTLAEGGNVAAGAIDRLASGGHNEVVLPALAGPPPASVVNSVPATGGAAAETLEHAQGRAGELATGVTRAVTLEDLRRLTLDTPGTRIARAHARANLHPAFDCVVATGVTTVIVLPYLPADRPEPSRGLLRAVTARLAPHRLIGSRIEVVGPRYTEVSVRAKVRAQPLADGPAVRDRVTDALASFLHPLSGGQDGAGWPFGRDVVRAEVLRVIDDVPGVDHVLALELVGPKGPGCGNLCIGPLGLVHSGAHEIEVVAE